MVPGPSGSLGPVLLRPGTFPGLPGTSRDLYFYSFAISWSHHYLTFLILSIFSSDFCQNWIIFFNHRNTTTLLVENEELCVKALLSKIYWQFQYKTNITFRRWNSRCSSFFETQFILNRPWYNFVFSIIIHFVAITCWENKFSTFIITILITLNFVFYGS